MTRWIVPVDPKHQLAWAWVEIGQGETCTTIAQIDWSGDAPRVTAVKRQNRDWAGTVDDLPLDSVQLVFGQIDSESFRVRRIPD